MAGLSLSHKSQFNFDFKGSFKNLSFHTKVNTTVHLSILYKVNNSVG